MVPWDGLQCVIAVFPDHTHLLFGKIACMNVFVSGHSSDNSDFEQPDTDQDCQFADTQTQISRSQPMEHPNERPGTVSENDPDQNEMDVSQPNETPQQAV